MKAWFLAIRPKTLWASVGPVFIGIAFAIDQEKFHMFSALAAFWGAIFIQVGTNFANDYLDFVKGADTEERVGPTRATQAGLITPKKMKLAFILTFVIATAIGACLVYRAGYPIVIVGIISIICGILYTGGPKPLGYVGLGDVCVLFFFGPVAVAGTYYVQALELNYATVVAGFGPGLISTAILCVNNLRDVETDTKANKRTLAVRFGKGFVRVEYLLCFIVAAAIPVILVRYYQTKVSILLASGIILPSTSLITQMYTKKGNELNPLLSKTALMLLIYCGLLGAGLLL